MVAYFQIQGGLEAQHVKGSRPQLGTLNTLAPTPGLACDSTPTCIILHMLNLRKYKFHCMWLSFFPESDERRVLVV